MVHPAARITYPSSSIYNYSEWTRSTGRRLVGAVVLCADFGLVGLLSCSSLLLKHHAEL